MLPKSMVIKLITKSALAALAIAIGLGSMTNLSYALDMPVTPPVTPPTQEGESPHIHTKHLDHGQVDRPYFERIKITQDEPGTELDVMMEGLPEGLELNKCYQYSSRRKTMAHCFVTGTPQEEGEFEVELTLASSTGHSTSQEYTLKIKPSPFRNFRWFFNPWR